MSNDSVHLDPERKKDKALQILAQNAYIGKLMSEGMDEGEARQRFRERYGRFFYE